MMHTTQTRTRGGQFISECRPRPLTVSLHLFTVSDNSTDHRRYTLQCVVVSDARSIDERILNVRYSLAFNGAGDFLNARRRQYAASDGAEV